ncbi:MAG: hypothetical protein J3K34DRAFT_403746 [Monoraphidium minutum]|nr:MAG: hypothetical protein J3K34DRAFT_403746 [Monoraphidium minutum]
MAAHLLVYTSWARTITACSHSVKGDLSSPGASWLHHLKRQLLALLALLPPKCWDIVTQLLIPSLAASRISRLSSSCVQAPRLPSRECSIVGRDS